VHTGPFANIAHGSSSILADRIGLHTADVVVTECGFGADCGFEKFCDIKCRVSGLIPDAAVLVCTVRALKLHGGVIPESLPPDVYEENMDALTQGCANLIKHLEIVSMFGVPVVVAVNRFPSDTDREIAFVVEQAKSAGAFDAVVSEAWPKGGEGSEALADSVLRACAHKVSDFRLLYELEVPLKEKIERIATKVYGAGGVVYASEAEGQLQWLQENGFGALPICMAKTHRSLSHDPALLGRPVGFQFPIREVRLAAGAGFVIPLAGGIQTMPGLPKTPAAVRIELDEWGVIHGLS